VDDNLDIAPKSVQESHQALDGETVQPTIRKCGNFWLIDVEEMRRARLRKPAVFYGLVDRDRKAHLSLPFVGARKPEIRENISGASGNASNVLGHVPPSARQEIRFT